VVWSDQKNTGVYKVHIGMPGKSLFPDSYPGQDNPDYGMIHAHLISKIPLDGDSLHIASLEGGWLKHMIVSKKLAVPHVVRHGDILLTASTEELPELVLRYAEDTGAFPNRQSLMMVPPKSGGMRSWCTRYASSGTAACHRYKDRKE
jgi:hypothetical protein